MSYLIKLISKETITGEDEEDESPLKYLEVIKQVRDEDPALFDRIKRLPVKARTARHWDSDSNALLTFFRKGKLEKFYLAGHKEADELDFLSAAKIMEVKPATSKSKRGDDFYALLDKNKKAFKEDTKEENYKPQGKGGRDTATRLLKTVKAIRKARIFTDKQENYLKRVTVQLEEGGLPKQTSKTVLNELKEEMENGYQPLKLYAIVEKNMPDELLEDHRAEGDVKDNDPREVILSEYLITEE